MLSHEFGSWDLMCIVKQKEKGLKIGGAALTQLFLFGMEKVDKGEKAFAG